jgi:hypothetical protein
MKNSKHHPHFNNSGQAIVVLIVLIVLIGGGLWYLYSNKRNLEVDCRAFGKEAVERLAVNHDSNFLNERLSPQARYDYPPSQQLYIISKLAELGTPAQPIAIEGTVTFESHFFEPRGYFIAKLNYPTRPATLEIGTSHPASRWQLDRITLNIGNQ